ncbi:MAG: hypothetical protein K6G15_05840 [Desulfovibrio sp.]|nr:hypothetical protein [Desulfovibrio sp.]
MRAPFPPSFPKLALLTLLLTLLLLPCVLSCSVVGRVEARFTGNIPYAGKSVAQDLDQQLMMRYAGHGSESARVREGIARARFLIMGTSPVNLNSLEESCPLARQMTEEVSSQLMALGYRYEELRKGKVIRFDRRTGELNLTRNVRQLTQNYGKGQAILAGTYVISDADVRFSFSLIHTLTNEVLAKASVTVPITQDIISLLDESPIRLPQETWGGNNKPNTYTIFQ